MLKSKWFFIKLPHFWESPYSRPGIVVRKLVEIISKYVIKKFDKIIFFYKSWSVVNYLQMYL